MWYGYTEYRCRQSHAGEPWPLGDEEREREHFRCRGHLHVADIRWPGIHSSSRHPRGRVAPTQVVEKFYRDWQTSLGVHPTHWRSIHPRQAIRAPPMRPMACVCGIWIVILAFCGVLGSSDREGKQERG